MPTTDNRNVFVVYGRNKRAMREMFAFLKMLNLSPTPWEEAVLTTSRNAPFIGETLDRLLQQAQAIVILLTGDDEAQPRSAFSLYNPSEDEMLLFPQPRANVLFETGMAFSHKVLASRTILVELGRVRICHSLEGRHRIKLSNKIGDRLALVHSLKAAGCPINVPNYELLRDIGNFNFD